jgi:hypothetical protein
MRTTLFSIAFLALLGLPASVRADAGRSSIPGPFCCSKAATFINAVFRHGYKVYLPKATLSLDEANKLIRDAGVRASARDLKSYGPTKDSPKGFSTFQLTTWGFGARKLDQHVRSKFSTTVGVHPTAWD